MNLLIETLKNPLLNISELERRVDCPKRTILLATSGARDLPEKWIWPICRELSLAGIPIAGWDWIYDNQTDYFVLKKVMQPDNCEVIEYETETETWFEYRVSETRHFITDAIELEQFFTDEEKV